MHKQRLIALVLVALSLVGHTSAVEIRQVEMGGRRFTVCEVDVGKEQLRLFLKDEADRAFKGFDRVASWLEARGEKLIFAMNAGMFHRNFSTVGLLVADGRQERPLNIAEGKGNFFLKPNGVFAVTTAGARILESQEYADLQEKVLLATQSGPLLVQAGKIHSAFRPNSDSRLIRNGVGIPSLGQAIFVISEDPVNFHARRVGFS